jgi:CBS domain-containing protein
MYEFLDWQVQDVMSEPVTIPPDTSLEEAQQLLESRGFNALPVVDASKSLVGLVTSLDLLAAFRFTDAAILPPYSEIMKRPVSQILSRDVDTVRPRTPLTRVLEKLVDSRCKSFPVLDGDDRVIGVVAREDVMAALRRADKGEVPSA